MAVYANTYYISNSGNDSENGTSESTAWKTIGKVNSIDINPGDRILFKAGGVWRETLNIKQGSKENRVYYGRYSSGVNPKILGSNECSGWSETSTANIWKCSNTINFPRSGGWGYPGDVFFITNNNTTWGTYRNYDSNFSELSKEFDWTWNSEFLYVFSLTNPSNKYNSIEASQRDFGVYVKTDQASYIEFDGIDIHFSKLGGFYTGYPEVFNQTDLTIRNCNISYIGIRGGAGAYGIEAHHSNFLVENCLITDCGRRGISFNFYTARPPGEELFIKNVIVRNNIFKRGQHTTSLDMATEAVCIGDTIIDVYFYNNIVDDSQIKMGENDHTSNQVYFQPSAGYLDNVYVCNNIFIQSTARNILFTGGDKIHIWHNTIIGHNPNLDTSPYGNVSITRYAKIDYRNNILYCNLPSNSLYNYGLLNDYNTSSYVYRDYNLYYQENINPARRGFTGGYYGYYDINNWDNFLNDNSPWEANSLPPQKPGFIDYNNFDFRIEQGSPCYHAGTPVNTIVTDAHGKVENIGHFDFRYVGRHKGTPSIGAIENDWSSSEDKNLASDQNEINIFPNPSNGKFQITSENNPVLQVFDISGNLLKKQLCVDTNTRIDFNYPRGIYFVQLSKESIVTKVEKIIIY